MKIIVEMTPDEYEEFTTRPTFRKYKRLCNEKYSLQFSVEDIAGAITIFERKIKDNEILDEYEAYKKLIEEITMLCDFEQIHKRAEGMNKDEGWE